MHLCVCRICGARHDQFEELKDAAFFAEAQTAELRAQLAASNSSADTFRGQRDELRAECERLKAELQDWKDGASAEAKSGDEARATLAEREARLDEYKREVERREEIISGQDVVLREREAEIDILRAAYKLADNDIMRIAGERDEARAALATARAEALFWAADIIEPEPDNNPWHPETRKALIDAANHLRALASGTKGET